MHHMLSVFKLGFSWAILNFHLFVEKEVSKMEMGPNFTFEESDRYQCWTAMGHVETEFYFLLP